MKYIGYFDKNGDYYIIEIDERDYDKISYYRSQYIAFEFDSYQEARSVIRYLEKKRQNRLKSNLQGVEVFISDVHIPYVDTTAEETLWEALEIINSATPINLIYLGGDIIDAYAVSDWLKNEELANIIHEIDSTKLFLYKLRQKYPNATIYYHEGNHEIRLMKTILKLEKVSSLNLRFSALPQILDLEKLGIKYIRTIIPDPFIGKLYHLHGHEKKFFGQVQHVALNLLRWLNKSMIAGHFHKFDIFYVTEIDRTQKGCFINGCLFDINKMPTPYTVDMSQKGISVIKYYNQIFAVEQINFIPVKGKKNKIEYKFYYQELY